MVYITAERAAGSRQGPHLCNSFITRTYIVSLANLYLHGHARLIRIQKVSLSLRLAASRRADLFPKAHFLCNII